MQCMYFIQLVRVDDYFLIKVDSVRGKGWPEQKETAVHVWHTEEQVEL